MKPNSRFDVSITTSQEVRGVCEFYKKLNRALSFFEQELGEISSNSNLKIEVGSLRTAYSMKERRVGFNCGAKYINCGVSSEDIVHHEVFHGLLCLRHSNLCDPDFKLTHDHEAAHEALAYYFGFLMSPDKAYGENYRVDMPSLKPYIKTLIPDLIIGSHGKGMGLFSQLYESNTSLKAIDTFLSSLRSPIDLTFESLYEFSKAEDLKPRFMKLPFQFSGIGPSRVTVPIEGLRISLLTSSEFENSVGPVTYSLVQLGDTTKKPVNFRFELRGFPLAQGYIEILDKSRSSTEVVALLVKDQLSRVIGYYSFFVRSNFINN